jgi:hypothetical protein
MRFRASIRGGCGRLIASFCRSCVRSPGKRGSGALRACGRDGGESRGQRLAAGVTKSLLAACNHHASFPPRRRRFANGCVHGRFFAEECNGGGTFREGRESSCLAGDSGLRKRPRWTRLNAGRGELGGCSYAGRNSSSRV